MAEKKLTLGQAKALRFLLEWHRDHGSIKGDPEAGFRKFLPRYQWLLPAMKTQTGKQKVTDVTCAALLKAGYIEDQKPERWSYGHNNPVRITVPGVEAVAAFDFPPEAERAQFEPLPEFVDVRTGQRAQFSGLPGIIIGSQAYTADQLRGDGIPKRGAWATTIGVRVGRGSYGNGDFACRGFMEPQQVREIVAGKIRERIADAEREKIAAETSLFDLYNEDIKAAREAMQAVKEEADGSL